MTITLKQMYEMQKKLDARIMKEKLLEGQVLIPKKILALFVELGECANEYREWKFWSNDQVPRNSCVHCRLSSLEHICKNPLLEEYVDSLHFVLSIGNDIKLIPNGVQVGNCIGTEDVTDCFNDTFISLADFMAEGSQSRYLNLLAQFLLLGKVIGFTWDQIAAAYMEKNRINHERQANGY